MSLSKQFRRICLNIIDRYFFIKQKTAYEMRISDWSSDVCSSDLYIRQSGQTSYHPIGTCKMGNDDLAVVDDRLRVRGIDRLRVVDASIMPTMPSSNTNAAALMIGEKGAALIREAAVRSEEHTSELQSLMRISYAVFCLKKKKNKPIQTTSL